MIILGVVLLLIGLLAHIPILWTIGVILLVVGAVLYIMGATGRAVGGRRTTGDPRLSRTRLVEPTEPRSPDRGSVASGAGRPPRPRAGTAPAGRVTSR